MKRILLGGVAGLLCALSISCASSVPVTVLRPAELDLNGADTISILPFKESNSNEASLLFGLIVITATSDSNNPETMICNYLTTKLTQTVLDSPYLKVVYPKYVETALKNGTEVPADVYLTGRIDLFNNSLSTKTRKEKIDEQEIEVPYYVRSVQLNIVYEIIDSQTTTVIASKSKSIKESSFETKTKTDVPSAFSVVEKSLDQLVSQITKELQPYEEKKYITLIAKDDAEPAIKTISKLATDGSVAQAKEQFLALYEKTGNFSAGYNAAMLMQAQGELYEAKSLIEELASYTGNKKAYAALRDIDSEIAQAERLERQISRQETNSL